MGKTWDDVRLGRGENLDVPPGREYRRAAPQMSRLSSYKKDIWLLHEQGWSQDKIAAKFGCSRDTIRRILPTPEQPTWRTTCLECGADIRHRRFARYCVDCAAARQNASAFASAAGKYGLSVKSYILLRLAPCACCGYSGKYSLIDHDHSCCTWPGLCGKCVRGPLCRACNVRGCLDDYYEIRPCAVGFAND